MFHSSSYSTHFCIQFLPLPYSSNPMLFKIASSESQLSPTYGSKVTLSNMLNIILSIAVARRRKVSRYECNIQHRK